MQKITPFLWFDNNAEEVANFYVSIFKNSRLKNASHYDEEGAKVSGRPKGTVMTVPFQLDGQEFVALNGGPHFKFTEAIYFFLYRKTEQEIDELFAKLSHQGNILMPLDKYPFSEKYAFIKDKYGVAWQIMLSETEKQITTCLLFVGKELGKAEAAVKFYTKVFTHSSIDHILHYKRGEAGQEGTVMHSSFLLEGQEFVAMDGAGPYTFQFNESISFVVNCETQEKVDYFWDKLSESGDPKAQMCGWLKDKFGVSWQIVPTILIKLLADENAEKSQRVMQAMLQMKKIDIEALQKAYENKN